MPGAGMAQQGGEQQQVEDEIGPVSQRRVNMLRRMPPEIAERIVDKEEHQQRIGRPLLAGTLRQRLAMVFVQ